MPADRGGFYPVLPPWLDDYGCPYLLLVLTPFSVPYYRGLFLRGGSDDIQRVITLTIFEFVILPGVQFFLYAVEGAVPDYFSASL